MRLGNQKAEMRRASMEEREGVGGGGGGSASSASARADEQFVARKKELCARFEDEVSKSPPDQELIYTLQGLQVGRITGPDCDHVELCALAEATISLLLKHLKVRHGAYNFLK